MKIIQVNFKERGDTHFLTGPYSFNCKFDTIEVDDLVIVDTVYGPNLAQVRKVMNRNQVNRNAGIIPTKNVIQVVDLTEYYKEKDKKAKYNKLEALAYLITSIGEKLISYKREYDEIKASLKGGK